MIRESPLKISWSKEQATKVIFEIAFWVQVRKDVPRAIVKAKAEDFVMTNRYCEIEQQIWPYVYGKTKQNIN